MATFRARRLLAAALGLPMWILAASPASAAHLMSDSASDLGRRASGAWAEGHFAVTTLLKSLARSLATEAASSPFGPAGPRATEPVSHPDGVGEPEDRMDTPTPN